MKTENETLPIPVEEGMIGNENDRKLEREITHVNFRDPQIYMVTSLKLSFERGAVY